MLIATLRRCEKANRNTQNANCRKSLSFDSKCKIQKNYARNRNLNDSLLIWGELQLNIDIFIPSNLLVKFQKL